MAVAADYRTRRFNGSGNAWATLEESLIERGTATSGGTVDFTTARSETCAEVARLEERTFEHSEMRDTADAIKAGQSSSVADCECFFNGPVADTDLALVGARRS